MALFPHLNISSGGMCMNVQYVHVSKSPRFACRSTDINGASLTDKLKIWEKPAFGEDKQEGHAALFVFRPTDAGDYSRLNLQSNNHHGNLRVPPNATPPPKK